MTHPRKDGAHPVWPWEERPRRRAGFIARAVGLAWPLPLATVMLLAAGYAWIGAVAGGAVGAVVGGLAGLLLSGLLYLVVERAVSGRRRSGPTAPRRTRTGRRPCGGGMQGAR
ncbi:hypothetical protein ACGFXB_12225 [Streptomyces canus]|uniref:hypothetical protein n=1 Tax=Streptomyces canus TaxID=58343 RepID=UPI00371472DA